jgi:hypothetical protein
MTIVIKVALSKFEKRKQPIYLGQGTNSFGFYHLQHRILLGTQILALWNSNALKSK